jgi:hypothetical protein
VKQRKNGKRTCSIDSVEYGQAAKQKKKEEGQEVKGRRKKLKWLLNGGSPRAGADLKQVLQQTPL